MRADFFRLTQRGVFLVPTAEEEDKEDGVEQTLTLPFLNFDLQARLGEDKSDKLDAPSPSKDVEYVKELPQGSTEVSSEILKSVF